MALAVAVSALCSAPASATSGAEGTSTVPARFTIDIEGATVSGVHGFCGKVYIKPGRFGSLETFRADHFADRGTAYSLEILVNRSDPDGSYPAGPASVIFTLGSDGNSFITGGNNGTDPRAGRLTISDAGQKGTFNFGLNYPNSGSRDVVGSFKCSK